MAADAFAPASCEGAPSPSDGVKANQLRAKRRVLSLVSRRTPVADAEGGTPASEEGGFSFASRLRAKRRVLSYVSSPTTPLRTPSSAASRILSADRREAQMNNVVKAFATPAAAVAKVTPLHLHPWAAVAAGMRKNQFNSKIPKI